jgi:hypothetical protein
VKVAFNRDAFGATLTYGATTTSLSPGVDKLSE